MFARIACRNQSIKSALNGSSHSKQLIQSFATRGSSTPAQSTKPAAASPKKIVTTPADALIKCSKKEIKHIQHALEHGPDKKYLDLLTDIILKRGFVMKKVDQEIILTKETDTEIISLNFYLWSEEPLPAMIKMDDEDMSESGYNPMHFFEGYIMKKGLTENQYLNFKCLYNPTLHIVELYNSSADVDSEEILYDGREMHELPDAVKDSLNNYLKSKGIDKAMAEFVKAQNAAEYKREKIHANHEFVKFLNK